MLNFKIITDVVGQYAFGRSDHRLDAPTFDPTFHDASIAGLNMSHLIKHMPWILTTMQMLPDKITIFLDPNMGSYIKLQRDVRKQVAEVRSNAKHSSLNESKTPTVFHEIL